MNVAKEEDGLSTNKHCDENVGLCDTAELPDEPQLDKEGDKDMSLYSLNSSKKTVSPATIGAMTLIKYVISLGILALPYAAARVGIVPAWILIVSAGYLNLYVLKLLDEVATSMGFTKIDLGRLCEKGSNKLWFRYLTEINLHIMCVGACIAYVVFISKYIDQVSCILDWTVLCDRKLMQFGLILALVLPVMIITDIHYLSTPNTIALVFQITFVLVFIVTSISLIQQDGVANGGFHAAITKFDYTALPCAFSTILFSYEAVGIFMEIRASVGESTKLMKVLNRLFVFAAVTYIIFASASVLAYGDATNSIIFLNLNQHNKFFLLVEFGYILAIILGVPTTLFAVMRIIENYHIFRNFIKEEEKNTKSKLKRQLIRLPLVILICGIAMVIPTFSSYLSFVSGINTTIMTCVIPVILYNLRFQNDKRKQFKRLVNWIILVIGIFLGAIATVQSVIDMSTKITATTT